jgi:hypothetical protein
LNKVELSSWGGLKAISSCIENNIDDSSSLDSVDDDGQQNENMERPTYFLSMSLSKLMKRLQYINF